MKIVNSNINLDIGKINFLSEAAIKSLKITADALKSELNIDQVIPFDTGNLSNNQTWVGDENKKNSVSLNFTTPYARRLYYHPEYNFQKKEHKNAKGKWLEDYLTGSKKNFARNTFSKIYEKEANLK